MDNTELVRSGIAELEKQISLLQIAKQSGISYLTLRKIKTGETKSVSSGVAARFEKFKAAFVPGGSAPAKKKPGPKPKATAAPAPEAPAKKKPGRKPKAAAAPAPEAPAKKKPGRKPKAAAAPAPEAPAKKKPGRKPKAAAAPAPEAPAKKKPGRKPKAAAPVKKTAAKKAAPKKKAGRPKKAAPAAAAATPTNFGTPMLGDALLREIEIAQARLEYLQSLQMVEEEFLKAIGKK